MFANRLLARVANCLSGSQAFRRRSRGLAWRQPLSLEMLEARTVLSAFTIAPITDTTVTSTDPAISADGNRIVFASHADLATDNSEGYAELFLYEGNSGTFTQLTETPALEEQLSISANGQQIAFVSKGDFTGENAEANSEIFLLDVDTGVFEQITDSASPKRDASISGDGNYVVFVSNGDFSGANGDGNSEIFLYDVAAAAFTQVTDTVGSLTDPNSTPSIDHDGSHIAFFSRYGLTDDNPDGNPDLYLFERLPSPRFARITDAVANGMTASSISADGTRIAFELRVNEYPWPQIFLYDKTINTIKWITHPTRTGLIGGTLPTISDDGSRISFEGVVSPGAFELYLNLYFVVYDIDASDLTRLHETAMTMDLAPPPITPSLGRGGSGGDGIPRLGIGKSHSLNADGTVVVIASNINESSSNPNENYEIFVAAEIPLPPDAQPDAAQTNEDAAVTIDILANDSDPNGDLLSLLSVTQPIHGQANINGDGTITYTPAADFNGSDQFSYRVGDGTGLTVTATISVVVTALNDAPVNVVPGTQSAQEDVALVMNGISVSDVDAAEGSGLLQVTLVVNNGSLAVNPSVAGGVSPGDIAGNDTRVVTLHGTQQAIHTTLAAGLSYRGLLNFHGTVELTVTTNDRGNTSVPGPLSDTDTVMINVSAVNDAPVNTVPGEQAAFEDLAAVISGIFVFDVDAAEGSGLLRVTLAVNNGTLAIDLGDSGGVTAAGMTGNGTRRVELHGTQQAINTTLAAGLTYLGAIDFHGMETLTITTDDQGNTGAPGPLTDIDTVTINVRSVEQQIGHLRALIQSLADATILNAGQANSLIVKLNAAEASVGRRQYTASVQQVQAFQSQVRSFARGGVLDENHEDELVSLSEMLLMGISIRV